jgi:hypothetical protein
MSVEQLESAVSGLSPEELARFRQWFDEFVAEQPDAERAGWEALAVENLARAYGPDEPEYTLEDIKRPL